MSPDEMQNFIQSEEKKWIPVIQKAGLATEPASPRNEAAGCGRKFIFCCQSS
jgi:hypothetical protein